jgi:hypothetical protein
MAGQEKRDLSREKIAEHLQKLNQDKKGPTGALLQVRK